MANSGKWMRGGFGHWLTPDFPVGQTLLPLSCPAGLCLDPGTRPLYSPEPFSPEAVSSLITCLTGPPHSALQREGLPPSSLARPRPTLICTHAVATRLPVTPSTAPNPLPGLLRKPGHTCTGTLSRGLCHTLTRHLGEMFMGRILISAVAEGGGINTGGIGWCTDFRQRHLAEGRGCLSPGPWLRGSGGGAVLRATRSEAAKAGLGVGSAASWQGPSGLSGGSVLRRSPCPVHSSALIVLKFSITSSSVS